MGRELDEIAQQSIKNAAELAEFIRKCLDQHAKNKQRMWDAKKMHWEAEQKVKLLAQITDNGKVLPVMLTYKKQDMKLYNYVMDKVNAYNSSEKTKDTVKVISFKNANGEPVILTNEAGRQKLADFRMQYAVEIGGYVSEIPTDRFCSIVKQEKVAIINNVSEDQYNFISGKVWGRKNDFSFTAEKNLDGTYKLAVLAKNYVDSTKRATKDDIFSSLISEKIANTDANKESLKYEKKLEKKVMLYDKDEPMYISQLRSGGIYMKVEKDKVTIMNASEGEIVIPKEKGKEEAYLTDVYKFYDRLIEPVEVTNEIKDKAGMHGKTVEEFLDRHAKTGLDEDFLVDKNGKQEYVRPICEDQQEIQFKADYAKQYTQEVSNMAVNCQSDIYVARYAEKLKDILDDYRIDDDLQKTILNDFKENLKTDYVLKNAPALTKDERMLITTQNAIEITDKYVYADDISSTKARHIVDAFRDEIAKDKYIMSQVQRNEFLKQANKAVSRKIVLKELDGFSKNFAKTINIAEAKGYAAIVDDTKNAVDELASDLDVKTLYVTAEHELSTELESDVEEKKRTEYRQINRQYDRLVESRANAEMDKGMGVSTLRTETEVKATTEETERTERSR